MMHSRFGAPARDRLLAVAACAVLAACATPGAPPAKPAAGAAEAPIAPALEREAQAHVDRMRTLLPGADAQKAALYNRQLEEAWKFFIANPGTVAVLRRNLARELTQKSRNDFILLDLGYYLHTRGAPADRELAESALFALDPRAGIIRYNQQELFQFTQSVAAARDERVLDFIDRAFLREAVAVPIPESRLTLDPATACAFLYGAYGEGAEAHLRPLLRTPVKDPALVRKVLDVLGWIGTPASNALVKGVLMGASRDYETFSRTASFLLNAGGPQGRAVVLAVQPDGLDLWTASFYDKIRDPARAASWGALRAQLAQSPASKAVLDADRPREELIGEVTAARTKLFRALPTTGSIEEIRRLGATLNALRYRDD